MSSTPNPVLTDPGDDLTRWNRAGLRRFQYVDGNAVTHLEVLRRELATAFPHWEVMGVGAEGPQVGNQAGQEAAEFEDPRRRLERLLAQYQGQRGDWGWEIARAFARALHVLTEHANAYANEATLATATQWQSLRRLVEMIDYRPAPPASAVTPWALALKAGEAGWVSAGLGALWAPPDGSPPVIFETLEALEADAQCNALRLLHWNRSPLPVLGTELVVEGVFDDLVPGQPVVVEHQRSGRLEARHLAAAAVDPEAGHTIVTLADPLEAHLGWRRGDLLVHLAPAERRAPAGPAETGAQVGRGVALVDPAEGEPQGPLGSVRPGEVVYLADGEHAVWAIVTRVDDRWVVLDREAGPLHLNSAWLSRPHQVAVADRRGRVVVGPPQPGITAVRVSGDYSRLQGQWVADRIAFVGGSRLEVFRVFAAVYRPVDSARPDGGGYTTLRLEDPDNLLDNPQALYVPPVAGERRLDSYLRPDGRHLPTTVELDRPAKKIAADEPAVMVRGRQLAWGRVTRVSGAAGGAAPPSLTVKRWRQRRGGNLFLATTALWGGFRHRARLVDWQVNATPLGSAVLPLEGSAPALLTAGRRLLLEEIDATPPAVLEARVVRVEGHRRRQLVVEPAPDARFTLGGCVVRANVVTASHGETQSPKVLGSGDGTRSGQSFVLEEEVAFVPEVTMPAGVAADVTVTVADRRFQQVPTLADCGPAQACFETRMTEDGHLRFVFGDGVHGQRLPTGANNLRVAFRTGRGAAGNVDAGVFVEPTRPHPLVEALRQPLPAIGGAAMEGAESLRTQAPESLLTLDRAVSLSDFSALAARQSSVWQARAFLAAPRSGRRGEAVEVVVVPAGGGPLGALGDSLRAFLAARALPGVEVAVLPYEERPVELAVRFRVRVEAFDPERVAADLSAALLDAFSLRRRRLGADLFASDIYRVAEAVAGVENTVCTLEGDPTLRRLRAAPRQLLFLEGDGRGLTLEPEEHTL